LNFLAPSIIIEMIYMDCNAGTMMPPDVISEINKWFNKGNASASYETAQNCRTLMRNFRMFLRGALNDKHEEFDIIFTSSASESNATVLRSIVHSFARYNGGVPHIISSAVEHKSIISCLEALNRLKLITYTLVAPNVAGRIEAQNVAAAIDTHQNRVALVSIMHANNETGVINDVEAIGALCHSRGIVFHTDIVQTAGKMPPRDLSGIDAMSMTFGKCLGPISGALLLRSKLVKGYKLEALISGTQNENMRGGTENIPMIAGAFAGYKLTMMGRPNKNIKMAAMKSRIIAGLGSSHYPVVSFRAHQGGQVPRSGIYIIIIGEATLPNTILFSVIKREGEEMCNTKMKEFLMSRGIIVSIGSACNTSSTKASHVLYAMGCDDLVRRGTIRVSLGDNNTDSECDTFVAAALEYIGRLNK
jgi:cysteine desulfurase